MFLTSFVLFLKSSANHPLILLRPAILRSIAGPISKHWLHVEHIYSECTSLVDIKFRFRQILPDDVSPRLHHLNNDDKQSAHNRKISHRGFDISVSPSPKALRVHVSIYIKATHISPAHSAYKVFRAVLLSIDKRRPDIGALRCARRVIQKCHVGIKRAKPTMAGAPPPHHHHRRWSSLFTIYESDDMKRQLTHLARLSPFNRRLTLRYIYIYCCWICVSPVICAQSLSLVIFADNEQIAMRNTTYRSGQAATSSVSLSV